MGNKSLQPFIREANKMLCSLCYGEKGGISCKQYNHINPPQQAQPKKATDAGRGGQPGHFSYSEKLTNASLYLPLQEQEGKPTASHTIPKTIHLHSKCCRWFQSLEKAKTTAASDAQLAISRAGNNRCKPYQKQKRVCNNSYDRRRTKMEETKLLQAQQSWQGLSRP
jgi:hypothetical protein